LITIVDVKNLTSLILNDCQLKFQICYCVNNQIYYCVSNQICYCVSNQSYYFVKN